MARWLEVLMALMLAVVAVATAWSGNQAARWDGEQSSQYAQAAALRLDATREVTLAGQATLYDLALFNEWLGASSQGQSRLAGLYERRLRSEFEPALQAWVAIRCTIRRRAEPFWMPQYTVSQAQKAEQLETAAAHAFEEGQAAHQHSDDYVLTTVLLAMVLFCGGRRRALYVVYGQSRDPGGGSGIAAAGSVASGDVSHPVRSRPKGSAVMGLALACRSTSERKDI
jgi:hypothetical protein